MQPGGCAFADFLAYAEPPAAVASAKPSVITQPDWLSKPSGEDLATFYPKDAARNAVEGNAVLDCKIDAAGALTGCVAASESPPGAGFGAAALAMSDKFKMRPMTRNGAPVAGGVVHIPIHFSLPKSPFPPIGVVIRCYGYAAAAAERNPDSSDIQATAQAWRMALEVGSLPERQRPSELEQLLTSLRKAGADKLDAEAFKAEREECRTALPASSPVVGQMLRFSGTQQR